MVINNKRRDMFVDLYRMAEYFEKPPFKPGDIEGNARFFEDAMEKILAPFIEKYKDDRMAYDLAIAVYDDASRQAAKANRESRSGEVITWT